MATNKSKIQAPKKGPRRVPQLPEPRRTSVIPKQTRTGAWAPLRKAMYDAAVEAADSNEPVVIYSGVPQDQKRKLLADFPDLVAVNKDVENGKADLHVYYDPNKALDLNDG